MRWMTVIMAFLIFGCSNFDAESRRSGKAGGNDVSVARSIGKVVALPLPPSPLPEPGPEATPSPLPSPLPVPGPEVTPSPLPSPLPVPGPDVTPLPMPPMPPMPQPPQPPTASGSFPRCECQDLVCWNQLTVRQMRKQLDCAADALGAAFPGIKPIYDFVWAIIGIDEEMKFLFSLAKGTGDFIGALDDIGYKTCLTACLKDLDAALQLLQVMRDWSAEIQKGNLNQDNLAMLMAIPDMMVKATDFINKAFDAIAKCNARTPKSKALQKKTLLSLSNLKKMITDGVLKNLKPGAALSGTNKADAIVAIAKCLVSSAESLYVAGRNTMCLASDLGELAKQEAALTSGLARKGSRLSNLGTYVGCSTCVRNRPFNGAEADYQECRQCCADELATRIPNEELTGQRASFRTACELTCAITRTEGLFYNYTATSMCREVLEWPKHYYHWRHIDWGDPNEVSCRADVAKERAALIDALRVVYANFSAIDNASGGSQDSLIGRIDFEVVSASSAYSERVRGAATFLANPYLYDLLASADPTDSRTDLVTRQDIALFIQEVQSYVAECELRGRK